MSILTRAIIGIPLALSIGFASMDGEMGVSIKLPANFKMDKPNSSNIRFYDSTGVLPALFSVVYHSKISENSSSPKDWTMQAAFSHNLFVETDPCYGVIFVSDSISQNGLFGMYSNTERGDCVDGAVFRYQHRFVALEDRGYELFFATDTADMKANYATYKAVLDSITFIRDVVISVERSGIGARAFPGIKAQWSPSGEVSIRLPERFRSNRIIGLLAHDAAGRTYSSRLLTGSEPGARRAIIAEATSTRLFLRLTLREESGRIHEMHTILAPAGR